MPSRPPRGTFGSSAGDRSSLDDELERTTVNDVYRHVALFAEVEDEIVGVGEYFASLAGEEAEVAFAVADAHHHEGVATVLLEDLAMVAKLRGFAASWR